MHEMRDKVVLVTGATGGLGLETAKTMAGLGATIIMVGRNETRGVAARREVAKAATGAEPVQITADLLVQEAIRSLADEVHARFRRLDVLVNNAGAIFARRELTVDGIEKTFALNHLAPFLLTNLLLDLVRAAPAGRIVTVASHSYSSTLDFGDLQSERGHRPLAAQFRSKLENILFTYELARRLGGSNVTANCLSPGPTVTHFGDDLPGMPGFFFRIVKRIPFLLQSVEKGAETQIQLASAPELAGVSGRFFYRGREMRTKPITYDRDVASRLWSLSEELTGLKATKFHETGSCAATAPRILQGRES
jgi:NAD(P)-dependent dehydrogenase (short-subunit alcohol dehydrogenase family)